MGSVPRQQLKAEPVGWPQTEIWCLWLLYFIVLLYAQRSLDHFKKNMQCRAVSGPLKGGWACRMCWTQSQSFKQRAKFVAWGWESPAAVASCLRRNVCCISLSLHIHQTDWIHFTFGYLETFSCLRFSFWKTRSGCRNLDRARGENIFQLLAETETFSVTLFFSFYPSLFLFLRRFSKFLTSNTSNPGLIWLKVEAKLCHKEQRKSSRNERLNCNLQAERQSRPFSLHIPPWNNKSYASVLTWHRFSGLLLSLGSGGRHNWDALCSSIYPWREFSRKWEWDIQIRTCVCSGFWELGRPPFPAGITGWNDWRVTPPDWSGISVETFSQTSRGTNSEEIWLEASCWCTDVLLRVFASDADCWLNP